MNIAQSLIIGIISGLVATLLTFVIIRIFNNLLLPWYRGVIYRGVSLEGEWERIRVKDDGTERKSSFYIKQVGHVLTGTAYSTAGVPLKFAGITRDGYVIGYFVAVDRRRGNLVSTLIKISTQGDRLEGLEVGRSVDGVIRYDDAEWFRNL